MIYESNRGNLPLEEKSEFRDRGLAKLRFQLYFQPRYGIYRLIFISSRRLRSRGV